MLLHLLKSRKFIHGAFLSFPFLQSDEVNDSPTAKEILDEYESQKETGKHRLFYMFSTDEFGKLSPELNSVLQVGFFGSFIGAMYGGVNNSKIAYLDFIENNQATAFKDHFQAKKKLQDAVTLSFGKGAFRWGWRLGLFCTSYMLVATSISVYRGKSSLYEYIAAGTITGAMYKFTMGPRGMLVGGLLGGTLGTAAGCVSLAILKLSGISMEEVRYWQYQFHSERKDKFRQAIKEHKEKDDLELLKEYKKKHENTVNNLESVDSVVKK